MDLNKKSLFENWSAPQSIMLRLIEPQSIWATPDESVQARGNWNVSAERLAQMLGQYMLNHTTHRNSQYSHCKFRTLNAFHNSNIKSLNSCVVVMRNADILFQWRTNSRTDGNFSWNIFKIIKYYESNNDIIIVFF